MLSRLFLLALTVLGLCSVSAGQTTSAPPGAAPAGAGTLFQNVRIFDGKGDTLSGPMHVLIRGNVIERITATSMVPQASDTVIEGGGSTLMPGLIDNHWHTMLVRPTPAQLLTGDVGYFNLLAGAQATATLMRGFTTVPGLVGPSLGLQQTIDEGPLARPAPS